jgi:hypothetical protein
MPHRSGKLSHVNGSDHVVFFPRLSSAPYVYSNLNRHPLLLDPGKINTANFERGLFLLRGWERLPP